MPKIYFKLAEFFRFSSWLLAGGALFLGQSAKAETPEQFARKFASFSYCFHAEIQDPQVFLTTKSGDCDDFATLAAATLAKSGYETQLWAVRMNGETHVVCYIPKIGGYLDYNNRAESNPVVSCDPSLKSIAGNVAASFHRNWVAAYEFSYHQKIKWLVNTIVLNRADPGTLLATAR